MSYSGGVYPARGGQWVPTPKRTPELSKYECRAHEAAHTLALLNRGIRVHRISVRDGRGSTFHEAIRRDLDAVAVDIAGAALEIAYGFPKNRGSQSDFDDANKRSASLGLTEDGLNDIIDEVAAEIREDRSFIDSIIGELERHGDELDQAQVESIAAFHGVIAGAAEPVMRTETRTETHSYPPESVTITGSHVAPHRSWLTYEKR